MKRFIAVTLSFVLAFASIPPLAFASPNSGSVEAASIGAATLAAQDTVVDGAERAGSITDDAGVEFTYAIYKDDTGAEWADIIYVSSPNSAEDGTIDLVYPAVADGAPVTKISNSPYGQYDSGMYRSVVIPASVEEIDTMFFENNSLKNVKRFIQKPRGR